MVTNIRLITNLMILLTIQKGDNVKILKFLFNGEVITSLYANSGLLILRIFAGIAIAWGHGIYKLPPSPGFVEAVSGMGFPAPTMFAWMSGLTEFFGGIFILTGFLTRPAALFLCLNMMTAAFIRHAGDPFSGKEKALLFLFIFLLFLLAGAGKYAVDNIIRKRWGIS